MRIEGIIDDNPSALMESPKLGFRLPDVLTVEEIERMIGVVDLSKPEGHRNKAIIETLYGAGLRVSELVGLKITDFTDVKDLSLLQERGTNREWSR
jgi:integrase/recombinase XerD